MIQAGLHRGRPRRRFSLAQRDAQPAPMVCPVEDVVKHQDVVGKSRSRREREAAAPFACCRLAQHGEGALNLVRQPGDRPARPVDCRRMRPVTRH